MDQYRQIQKQIAALKPDFKTEIILLKDALNRVLQEDVLADSPMPPFDKSAMDGFACRIEDINNALEILEILQAGMVPTKTIGNFATFLV